MADAPTGHTRVAAVIGDPVRHSLSPVIHNAAFAAAELDWTYVAFEVPAGAGRDAVAAMATLGLGGLSVTMPHKTEVFEALERLSPAASRLRAVNCVAWEQGDQRRLVGHNTDGDGFVDAIEAAWDFVPSGQRCLVLGAGGAARAVVAALGEAGAADIAVVNRTESRAAAIVDLAPGIARVGTVADIAEATLIVNATSVGMAGAGADSDSPAPPELLADHHLVVDLIYNPLETPLIRAASIAGARAINGVGMLVHQAARAFELWTGAKAPLGAMEAAVAVAVAEPRS